MDRLQQKYPRISRDGQIHGNGPAVYYRIPGAKGSIGFISAMHGKFCKTCNRLHLTVQGRLKPCLCFGESIDLWKILRAGSKDGRRDVQGNEEVRIQVKEAVIHAAREKPESHRFEKEKEITESGKMVQIGG